MWEKESLRPNIDTANIAETLTKELIWAKYLPNGAILKSKVFDLLNVLNKYLYILENVGELPKGLRVSGYRNWVWGIASAEIEDLLDPSNRDLYIKLMFDWFMAYFEWQNPDISEEEKRLQIYLAIHRAYTKSDDSIMRYHLLLQEIPNWNNAALEDVGFFLNNFSAIFINIEDKLKFPGWLTLYRRVQKHVAAFEIFRDIAVNKKRNLRKLLLNEKRLETKVKKVCVAKYKLISKKVRTGIIRSIIYIFITKVLLALLIEVPYEVIRLGDVRYIPLMINILVPPTLMWIIGFSIKTPGTKNTHVLIARLDSIVYKPKNQNKQKFSTSRPATSTTLLKIFGLFYIGVFFLVFGGLTYLLWQINFTIVGILIFFFFLSVVMLFAFRIRFNSNQLKVDADDEGFVGHIINYLTLPFLNLGFYLSRGLAKINFFTIIFDFIIEAPLKTVLEIIEEWTSFIRQKKEEVVEMPE